VVCVVLAARIGCTVVVSSVVVVEVVTGSWLSTTVVHAEVASNIASVKAWKVSFIFITIRPSRGDAPLRASKVPGTIHKTTAGFSCDTAVAMKTNLILATAAFALLASAPVGAQTVVHETTTTVPSSEIVGTVTELAPGTIVVRTGEAAAPVRYTFTKTTEYVDEAGNRIAQDIVKAGVPVTIRYVKKGDHMVVSRVIVRKQTTTTAPAAAVTTQKTTTTTTKE